MRAQSRRNNSGGGTTLSASGQQFAVARSEAFGIVLPEYDGERGPLVTEERTWAVACNLSIN
jgi:hypothetical protein